MLLPRGMSPLLAFFRRSFPSALASASIFSVHPRMIRPRIFPLMLIPIFSHRLALVHLLIKAQFGLLHPVVKDAIMTEEGKVKEGLRIADVGTGTG